MARRLLILTVALASITAPAQAGTSAALGLSADLTCLRTGGAHIRFSIENLGPRRVRIDPDFHLWVHVLHPGGTETGMIAFVFPSPDFASIPSGQTRTFELNLGEAFDGEPGTDLSGRRIRVDAEVWLAGVSHPAVKRFSMPACPSPEDT